MVNNPNFIYKIGPIPAQEGFVNTYFVYPGLEGAETFVADQDRDALSEIASTYTGTQLECEPSLSQIAAEFEISEGTMTPERAHMIGLVTLDMILGDQLQAVEREGVIYQMGMAASAFWASEPWKYRFAQHPVIVDFQGSVTAVLEGVVMGASGVEYGLILYPDEGMAASVQQLYQEGRSQEAASLNSLSLSFQAEPEFAISAMERAYGLPRLVVPAKVLNSERVLVSDLDLLALAAALQALSALTDDTESSYSNLRVADLETVAVVRSTQASREM
jgi:hypothetical protein